MIPKFRAWHKKFKEMYKILCLDFESGMASVETTDTTIASNVDYWFDFDSCGELILMQSTGLFDKNGVELFEGDVCKYWMDDGWKIGVIIRIRGGWAIHVKRYNGKTSYVDEFKRERKVSWIFKLTNFGCCNQFDESDMVLKEKFEVIGNDLNNPELLEGESDDTEV